MFSRLDILGFWQKAKIAPSRLSQVKAEAETLFSFKDSFYQPVADKTGVPWYIIGLQDDREESFRHNRYLGNGDLLSKKTVNVPAGRGPFKGPNAWQDGAVDAIHISGWDRLPTGAHWDIVTALMKLEMFNGMGYAHMGLRSPYIWGATNMQQRGKYVRDRVFDASVWDVQLGCASLLLALKQFHGVDLNEA